MSKEKIIILMGPPGSGKGTQAKMLAKELNYTHISTGAILRSAAAGESVSLELKDEIQKMLQGKLVSDKIIFDLVFPLIEKDIAVGKGVILDGAIRNLSQAEEYGRFFAEHDFWKEVKAFWLELTTEESLNRLTMRRECQKCGAIIPYLPETKNLTACPKCGGALVKRTDDKGTSIHEKRMQEQGKEAQMPIINYFKERGVLTEIDGSQDIDLVFSSIKRSF